MTDGDSNRQASIPSPRIEEKEVEGHSVWVATDDVGVAVAADDQEGVRRLLAEGKNPPGGESEGNAGAVE